MRPEPDDEWVMVPRDSLQRYQQHQHTLIYHSMFAYPHFWLWHAMFDGTRLCRCWHSKEMYEFQRPNLERVEP